MKTKFLIIFCFLFFIGCASKIPITQVPQESAQKIESDTHRIDFDRLSHSIPKGKKYEAIQGGAFCELQQGWAVGGFDAYSQGPGVPLYNTQAENDALGIKRPDFNLLAFKTIEDTLKKNNIKISREADLKLTALVTDLKINTCVWLPGTKGESYYKIKWQLYSKTLKKDLFVKEFESYTKEEDFEENNVQKRLVDIHEDNTNKLINDKEFRKIIDSNNFYIGTDENSI